MRRKPLAGQRAGNAARPNEIDHTHHCLFHSNPPVRMERTATAVVDPHPGKQRFNAAALGHRSVLSAQNMRSEEHTSELQSLMRISYAVFCLKKKIYIKPHKQQLYYYR